MLSGCGCELNLTPNFEGCVYFCSLGLDADEVSKFEGDATQEVVNLGSDVVQDCFIPVRYFLVDIVNGECGSREGKIILLRHGNRVVMGGWLGKRKLHGVL